MLHHCLDLLGAALAFLNDRNTFLFREAILYVNLLEQLEETQVLVFCPSGDFSQHDASRYGVFITNEVLAQEAVALLATTDVVLLALVLAHNVGDPFEACVNVVDLNTITLCDSLDCLGCYDCLDYIFLTVHLVQLFPAGDQVINEHQGCLVTVQQYPFALIVLNGRANTVSVRVGSHNQLGVGCFRLLDSHSQSGGLFGVRRDNGREVATYDVLLRNVNNILESKCLQRSRNQLDTCSVDRRVDNLHILMTLDRLGRERDALKVVDILAVDLLTDDLDQCLVTIEFDIFRAMYLIDLGDGILIVWGDHLRAVVPISLVTVIFFRIV